MTSGSSSTSAPRARLRSLDGLRGAAAFFVLAVLLTTARWNATGLGADPPHAKQLTFLAVLGVWLSVLAAAFSSGVRAVCERGFLQWAGRISFSLYLFERFVESRFHRLAQQVGRALHRRERVVV